MTSELLCQACLIDGQWVDAGQHMEVHNPATGELVGTVPEMGRAETEWAIAAAERAQLPWARLPAVRRAEILKRFASLMRDRQEELAALLTQEQGKPLAEARSEIAYAAGYLEWYGEEARRCYGEIIPPHVDDMRLLVTKRPVGVVAAITPWNFPAAMVTRKIGPALAAGCAVVLKPAHQTPFTALALGALAIEAGVPAGVLNIVTGQPVEIAATLTESPVVRKLSFTGSTAVGAALYAQCAPTIKKLSLELGGNAPFLVFNDADCQRAVEGLIASKFRNAGQTCVCANRVFVQSGIYGRFLEHLTDAVSQLKVGDGREEGVQIGPLVDDGALRRVERLVADARAKGADVLVGGARHERGGLFFEPTLLANVTSDMAVCEEEIFGPVVPVLRFDHEHDAIRMANATPYGLAAYAFTSDADRILRLMEQVESGMIGINTGIISTEIAPFGGIKASGLGREGGRQGIEDYLEVHFAAVRGSPLPAACTMPKIYKAIPVS